MKELANQSVAINSGKNKLTVTFDDKGIAATTKYRDYVAQDSYGYTFIGTELLEDLEHRLEDFDEVELCIEPETYYYGEAVASIYFEAIRQATEEEKKQAKRAIAKRLKSQEEAYLRQLEVQVAQLKKAGYKVSKAEGE